MFKLVILWFVIDIFINLVYEYGKKIFINNNNDIILFMIGFMLIKKFFICW